MKSKEKIPCRETQKMWFSFNKINRYSFNKNRKQMTAYFYLFLKKLTKLFVNNCKYIAKIDDKSCKL